VQFCSKISPLTIRQKFRLHPSPTVLVNIKVTLECGTSSLFEFMAQCLDHYMADLQVVTPHCPFVFLHHARRNIDGSKVYKYGGQLCSASAE
jgi:hypothetical protein